jgi:hypothetical protein
MDKPPYEDLRGFTSALSQEQARAIALNWFR